MTLRGRTVLVTGADGFIGSHLVEALVRDEGATVRALCAYNALSSYGWLDESPVLPDIEVLLGDVRDHWSVDQAVRGADVVLHLAALISIPYSYEAPRSYIETNVLGTMHVLEAAQRHDVERVVHTSTSEVYGTPDTVPITEDHPLRGQSPYSASKIAADKLCEAWAASFGTPVVVLRPFNTFGPRQSRRAVIPSVLTQLLRGSERLIVGSLDPRRDFTYVSDTVAGFLRAAVADLASGETVQLGTGRDVSIAKFVEIACSLVGVEPEIVVDEQRVRPAASEVQVLRSDPTRAADLLGWRPTVSFETGLRNTIEFLRHQNRMLSDEAYRR